MCWAGGSAAPHAARVWGGSCTEPARSRGIEISKRRRNMGKASCFLLVLWAACASGLALGVPAVRPASAHHRALAPVMWGSSSNDAREADFQRRQERLKQRGLAPKQCREELKLLEQKKQCKAGVGVAGLCGETVEVLRRELGVVLG